MGLGTVGQYGRFRAHMLRKFHSSNLKKGGMSVFDINILQGKSNSAVNDVYFFEDIPELKKKYIKAMPNLLIFTDGGENLRLKQENELMSEQLRKYETLRKDIEAIRSWFEL